MHERTRGMLATVAGAGLLAGLLAGGGAARLAAVLAAVAGPPLLIALAGGEARPGPRRVTALVLAAALAAGAVGILLLDGAAGSGEGVGGLPPALRWMLVVLCALPWAVTSAGFAVAQRTRRR